MEEVKDGQYYSLGSRVLWFFVVKRSIVPMIIFCVDILFSSTRPLYIHFLTSGWINNILKISGWNSLLHTITIDVLILGVVGEIIAVSIAWLEYSISKIMLDGYSLKIVRGIMNREEIEIPYRHIQSVRIEQSPLNQLFNVGELVVGITTDVGAQGKNNDQIVPLLNHNLAEMVAQAITDRAQVERMQVQGTQQKI